MLDFTHIRYGIAIALVAILFGGMLGLSFGCCEDSIKGNLRASADAVLDKHYSGDANKAVSTVSKSWVYFKRAHLHSQTMGVMAIVFALLTALLNFQPKFQLGISLLSRQPGRPAWGSHRSPASRPIRQRHIACP